MTTDLQDAARRGEDAAADDGADNDCAAVQHRHVLLEPHRVCVLLLLHLLLLRVFLVDHTVLLPVCSHRGELDLIHLCI